MQNNKKVLLIGGGGTLGTYTSMELLSLGYSVDILCPEEKTSFNERLHFIKGYGTEDTLKELFKLTKYDGIVNFIHYPDPEEYKPIHKLLTDNTKHLIFLSSYRVYADLKHPVTEDAPQLIDTSTDEEFLRQDTYGLSKSKAEHFIINSSPKNWTIIRPVISFSDKRLDLVVHSGHALIDMVKAGRVIPMPEEAKDKTAGLDWAGNSGKLIAHLLFKEDAFGEAFTVSSAQNLTWGQVADIYTELIGATFEWFSTEKYMDIVGDLKDWKWNLYYDRLFDRNIDNSKILRVTGLKSQDFVSIKDGIITELKNLNIL